MTIKLSAAANIITSFSNHSKNNYQIYKNPCLDLLRLLEIPLFKENELYSPSWNALLAAEDLFVPKRGHKICLLSKTIDCEKFPTHDLPEVAFMGCSNSGKSSLLKAIFKNVPDLEIKTSKKPGHTKSFQFFNVGSKLCLIDMPGYGVRQPNWFEPTIQFYLKSRKNLLKTFVITDGEAGLQDNDHITIGMLEEYRIPYCLVVTKIDKIPDSQRLKNILHIRNVRNELNSVSCFSQPFLLSSLTHEGLIYFLSFIGHITGNLNCNE